MTLFNFLKFKKTQETEDEYLDRIANENKIEASREASNMVVIKYIQETFSSVPEIIKITEFKSSVLPDKGSIIWAPDSDKKQLLPYKVIRFDFIQETEENNKNVYIVVTDAEPKDIMNTFDYSY